MKKNKIIHVCGSIIKKESIAPLTSVILENTCVAEANMPYSNYYGPIPERVKPNSVFLFTVPYYTLEEVLRFTQSIHNCSVKNVNVASAVLNFHSQQAPAIRVKNLSDYKQLEELQKCFARQGVEFARKFSLEKEALVRINKCFVLEEVKPGIYLDKVEKDKGYVISPKLINYDEFEDLISELHNNTSLTLFDAVKAGIVMKSKLTDLIRIYSENLKLTLLDDIKQRLEKILLPAYSV